MGTTATLPYWRRAGTERCGGCHHIYVLETGYRCVGCDTGVCVCCAVIERSTREVWCPECHAEASHAED